MLPPAAAGWLQPLNIPEPHKAPFAAGDAEVLGGNFDAARQRFAEALDLVPGGAAGSADACVIRVNLVLATERLGDDKLRAEDPASAAALVLRRAGRCRGGPGRLLCQSLGDTVMAPRGSGWTRPADAWPGSWRPPAKTVTLHSSPLKMRAPLKKEADSPQQSQLEQLEESARQSQRERNTRTGTGGLPQRHRVQPGPGPALVAVRSDPVGSRSE